MIYLLIVIEVKTKSCFGVVMLLLVVLLVILVNDNVNGFYCRPSFKPLSLSPSSSSPSSPLSSPLSSSPLSSSLLLCNNINTVNDDDIL